MAKALLGYVGGPDPRLVSEVRPLQQRVQDLETELLRLQAEFDHLAETVDADHLAAQLTADPYDAAYDDVPRELVPERSHRAHSEPVLA